MRHPIDKNTHLRLVAALALAVGVSTIGTSCIEPNRGYCMYQGGDAWCRQQGRGEFCYALVDDSVASPAPDGCYDVVSASVEKQVHVKYGLPSYVLNEDAGLAAGAESFATMEGIHAVLVGQGVLEAGCEVAFDALRGEVMQAKALREDLEPKKTETKPESTYLTAEQRQRVEEMNAGIDEQFDPCLASTGTGTGTGTDTGGTATETGDTDGSTTTGDESSSGSSTTGPVPCMGDEECTDPAAPVCGEDGVCVPCDQGPIPANGDAACAAVDPMTPVCFEGACVECTASVPDACTDQLLLCDEMTNACVPCTEHDQCEAGACDLRLETPTCFEPDQVLHVGMGQPVATIEAALTQVGSNGWTRAVLVLHQGTSFDEARTVSSGAIAFVAADGESPQWVNTSAMAPTLTVSGAATRVYVDGVRLGGNLNDVGLSCNGATVDVRRSRIVQNTGGGIETSGACGLWLENSFVGGGGAGAPAVSLAGGTGDFLYSTFFNSAFAATPAVQCDVAAQLILRNSIVVTEGGTPGAEFSCANSDISFTAAEAELPGVSNTGVNAFPDGSPQTWFVSVATGNFALQMSGLTVFANVASWLAGDPATDIHGDARPVVDGAPDYAGADVP